MLDRHDAVTDEVMSKIGRNCPKLKWVQMFVRRVTRDDLVVVVCVLVCECVCVRVNEAGDRY